MLLSIGLMSGTSMDGIDAALLQTTGTPECIKPLGHTSIDYDPAFKILLKAAEYTVRKYAGDEDKAALNFYPGLIEYLNDELKISKTETAAKLKTLATYLYGAENHHQTISLQDVILHSSEQHALIVRKLMAALNLKANQIDVIGYHGQTLYHRADQQISIIVGDAQYLANQLGIKIVNDFRRKDVQSGGQGAPLAPIYHQALAIRDHKIPLAVVNCGGISNITIINSSDPNDLIGFDTGPGNALVDRLIRQRTQGVENMDKDGKYGKNGHVNQAVLTALYATSIQKDAHNYFKAAPPKSLDYGDMALISELDSLSLEDACRTLEAFTADTIVNSLDLIKGPLPLHWVLAGGGWNNPVIVDELTKRLIKKVGPDVQIMNADEVGWNSTAMEAQIFAYLAVRSLKNYPISVPGTTGVPEPLSGGVLHQPISV